MIKNYDNIAKRRLVAVTDDTGASGSLTDNQGAPGPILWRRAPGPGPLGVPGPLTDEQGGVELLIDNQGTPGAPNWPPGGSKAPNRQKRAPGSLTDKQGALGPLTNNQGAAGPLTDNQEARGP